VGRKSLLRRRAEFAVLTSPEKTFPGVSKLALCGEASVTLATAFK